jgi:hypothetical protein
MRMPMTARRAVLIAASCLCAARLARADAARDQAWREDLRTWTTQLRAVHPKPFARVPEARFDSAAAALDAAIPRLSDAQVAVGLMRLDALIQDGHTIVAPVSKAMGFGRVVPVRIYVFEDGPWISAAGAPYARYAGARVVRIGDVTAEEALRRALEITPADNEMTRLDRAPFFLTMPSILEALGICADGSRVAFEVRTAAGATERFTARAEPDTTGRFDWFFEGESLPLPGARTAHDDARAPLPLHLRDPQRAYWFEWLPDSRMLYVQLRRIERADAGTTIADFFARTFAFSDSVNPQTFVLDIRHDHGGDNTLLTPLIHGLIRREGGINTRGRLYTIIGRGTFSAAQNCANWIEEHTQTLFVGEPTGGKPNHYGDNQPVQLPHHPDVLAFVSHWPWQARLPWDDRVWIAPHIAAPLSSADYRENRDPALAAILAYRGEPPLADQLRAKVRAGGRAAAAAAYQDYARAHPDRWGRTHEAEVDALGYALLGEGRTAEAVAILGLNAERYPGSANAWDSLAEATLAAGDRDAAERLYRKALAIDPGFRSSLRALERLSAH